MKKLLWAWTLCLALGGAQAAGPKLLRVAFPVAETTFDPARISDLYSRTVTAHLFEALYGYDHLARPARIVPLTAQALPEVSADFRSYTIRLRPGILFSDDPAFGGRRRELVAEDYVYAFKRFADPAVRSPAWGDLEEAGFTGLNEYRREVLASKQAFDYDRPIPGLFAVDRHTLRLTLDAPRPRLIETLASSDLRGAVAREVVERYGDKIGEHPVGTGPFVLAQWRRSSFIALERNPRYRERRYDAEPAADDAEGQALRERFLGRTLPMVDRVEVSIIEENQPRWLAFLNGQQDLIDRVPPEFIAVATPRGELAPNLARRGVQAQRTVEPSSTLTVFNMDDPLVGGVTPERVALRRAISLGTDIEREIELLWRGQAVAAQSLVVPHTRGYDAAFESEASDYDLARGRALLELYGWRDRDGDGWREQPDGAPLRLVVATQPDSTSRQIDELMQKNLSALGLRSEFRVAKWPENLKSMQAGKSMIWRVGSKADKLDGQSALQRLYGPSGGGANLARFRWPAFDALYERMHTLPNGPERDALFTQAKRIGVAYVPYKVHVHRIVTDLAQPRLAGYRRPLFWMNWWEYADVEAAAR